jgi:hypothetical protein
VVVRAPVRLKAPSADERIKKSALAVLEDPDRYGGEESLIVRVSRATIARLEKEKEK